MTGRLVMVCEEHPWRLWPDGDPDCAGPGMPLSGVEWHAEQFASLLARVAAADRLAELVQTYIKKLDAGYVTPVDIAALESATAAYRATAGAPEVAG